MNRKVWEAPTMTVIADSKKRVVIPLAKPGDRFDVSPSGTGTLVLTRLEPAKSKPAKVKIEKRGRFSVGVLAGVIDPGALREALADFP
jgi:hypothetical protein